jgi:hypothetical protein
VLSHILGSNKDICGYKELHMSYKDQWSLINMQIELVKDLKCKLRNKYLLDKILHNSTISDEILFKAKPKILFLLREPESTIKSIINMGNKKEVEWCTDAVKVTEYYCNRLKQMGQLAQRINKEYLFIESNDLIENSDNKLRDITNWLDLKEPLTKNYSTFNYTGVMGFGDPLENIKSGVLKATSSYSHIEIPQDLLSKAETAYFKCKNTIINI